MVEITLSEDEYEKITKHLNKKLKLNKKNILCPFCGNRNFIIANGYTNRFLSNNINKTVIGGRKIPSIIIICDNCGYMGEFATGVLGLLSEGETCEEKK